MRSVKDLRDRLKPGSILRVTALLIDGQETKVSAEQGVARRVEEVRDDAIIFTDGKCLPLNCAGTFQFIGAPDSFTVSIGPAVMTYDIAEGTA